MGSLVFLERLCRTVTLDRKWSRLRRMARSRVLKAVQSRMYTDCGLYPPMRLPSLAVIGIIIVLLYYTSRATTRSRQTFFAAGTRGKLLAMRRWRRTAWRLWQGCSAAWRTFFATAMDSLHWSVVIYSKPSGWFCEQGDAGRRLFLYVYRDTEVLHKSIFIVTVLLLTRRVRNRASIGMC